MDAQEVMLKVVESESATITLYRKLLEESHCPACHTVLEELISDEYRHLSSALHILKNNPDIRKWLEEGESECIDLIRKNTPMVNDNL